MSSEVTGTDTDVTSGSPDSSDHLSGTPPPCLGGQVEYFSESCLTDCYCGISKKVESSGYTLTIYLPDIHALKIQSIILKGRSDSAEFVKS